MQQPLVSVIIPTYNRADKVVAAIKSVEGQAYGNIQLIVVDDGSNDGTQELLCDWPGIEYVYQENGGQAAARNTGLARAKGELIASLDSDDCWDRLFLEKCVGALLRHDLDFVFANWNQKVEMEDKWRDFLSSDPYLKPFCENEVAGWYVLEPHDLRKLYLQACPSPSSSVVMKRTSIVCGWNNRLNIGDDWGLYLDMILNAPCNAAFTLERLWYKDIDGQNIFDGRRRADIVKLLLIDDTKEIINRYQDKLTANERDMLKKQYVGGLVELSKHVLLREYQSSKAWDLFREAYSIHPKHSFATIFTLMRVAIRHRFSAVHQRSGLSANQ